MTGTGLPSIKAKLARLAIAPLFVALVLTTALHLWREAALYLDARREGLLATAQVFAAAASASTAGADRSAVQQTLRGVSRVPGLVRAQVEDASGRVLAELGTAIRLSTDPDIGEGAVSPFALMSGRTITVTVPIVESGRTVGRLAIVGDISGFRDDVLGTLAFSAAVSGLIVMVSLMFSRRLQRSITDPLVSLTAAMSEVEANKRYEPIAVQARDAETHRLVHAFNGMIVEIRESFGRVLDRENEIIERLSRAGEMKDDQTGQHVVRVARTSRLIAEALGLDGAYIDDLQKASPMHDVGKISIPEAILHKKGRLDSEERAEMERHAERGHRILRGSQSPLIQLAAEIALSHHEKWDGTGYPAGLSGTAIPLSGRITAVADVCDALLSERPYKAPWPLEKVRLHLEENSGSHFDPDCVAAILARWGEIETMYRRNASADLAAA